MKPEKVIRLVETVDRLIGKGEFKVILNGQLVIRERLDDQFRVPCQTCGAPLDEMRHALVEIGKIFGESRNLPRDLLAPVARWPEGVWGMATWYSVTHCPLCMSIQKIIIQPVMPHDGIVLPPMAPPGKRIREDP